MIDPAVPFTLEENGLTFTVQSGHAVLTAADKSLTSVAVPAMAGERPVTGIGDDAFKNCRNLSSITLPEGLISIDDTAFDGCTALTGITLPESLTSIGNFAFINCSTLSSLTLPEGLTSIGEYAFSGCSQLTGITLPESLTGIGSYAFDNYTYIYDGPQPLRISIHARPGSYAAEFFKDDPRLVIDG